MQDVGKLQIYSNFSNLTTFAPFSRFVSAFCQSLTQLFNALVAKTNTIGNVAYFIARGSTTSVPTATTTTIIFTTVDRDTHNAHVANSGIFTVPFAGMAYVSACANLEAPSLAWTNNEIFRLCVNHNGSDIRYNSWITEGGSGDQDPSVNIVAMFPVEAGDTIKICAYQNSGSTCAMQGSNSTEYNYVQIAIDQRV